MHLDPNIPVCAAGLLPSFAQSIFICLDRGQANAHFEAIAMRVALGMAFAHVAALLAGTEPAKAQGLFGGLGPPTSYQYFQPPSQYVAPPTRSKRREIKVSAPPPETTFIDEKYAKDSIVIVNHERNLYFVEEPGRATRYPVAIGTSGDQWEGVETITAKRENPRWFPSEDVQWETRVPHMVPPGPQNPLGPRALYLGNTLYRIHGTNRPGYWLAISKQGTGFIAR